MTTLTLRPLLFGGLLLAGIGALATGAATTNSASAWGNQAFVTTGPNLPGGQSYMDKIDHHIIFKGYKETCQREIWTLPREYTNVQQFLESHPDAKPDYSAPEDAHRCHTNAIRETLSEPDRSKSYYSGITGSLAKEDLKDSICQDKV